MTTMHVPPQTFSQSYDTNSFIYFKMADLKKWLAMINLGENCMSESLGPFFALPVALTTQQFKYWQIE